MTTTDACTHGGDCEVHPDVRQLHGDLEPAEVQTISYVGIAGVAAWFGVDPATVTTWIKRYATTNPTPRPNAVIKPGRTEDGDKGWLPAREAEWRTWEASRTGQGAPGMPKPRREQQVTEFIDTMASRDPAELEADRQAVR